MRPQLVAGDQLEHLGHLHAELTRRDEDERCRTAAGRVEALEDRNRERERLARPRRALREDVAAAKRLGDHECLDLERGLDAAAGEYIGHGLGHPEGTKICHLSQLLGRRDLASEKETATSRERGPSALRIIHGSRGYGPLGRRVFDQPQPVLELRDPQFQLVPLVARHEAELARELLHTPSRPLADAQRVAAPARAEVVDERAKLVEARPEQLGVSALPGSR